MKTVAVVVQEGVEAFGLGCLVEVWGEPYHPRDDNPVFDFRICASTPGPLRGRTMDVTPREGLEWAVEADLVAVAPHDRAFGEDPAVIEALEAAYAGGSQVMGHCTAAFTLGRAGLLDGRRCTTHWRYAAGLQRMFPKATVDADVLYVHEGRVLTGAGSAAALDASLHLMRERFGGRHAANAARRIVVPPHRSGGQAQFIATPIPEVQAETLGPLLTWMGEHLDEDLSVARLSRQAHLSERTFARRFRDETGTTPHAWILLRRVQAAEELLEQSDLSIEGIAGRVGFGTAAALRQHFARVRGVSPSAYRRQFSLA